MQMKPILWRITFGTAQRNQRKFTDFAIFTELGNSQTRAFEDALRRKKYSVQSLWRFKFLPKKRNQRFGGVFKTFGQ